MKPMAQRVYIMFSEILHVAHLEASCLCRSQEITDRYALPIGEHVAADEVPPEERRSGVNADAMVEEDATWTEQVPRRFKVGWQRGSADMLDHADGDELVIAARFVHLAIITDVD